MNIEEIKQRKVEIRNTLEQLENGEEVNADLNEMEEELRNLNEQQADMEKREQLKAETADIENGKGETRKVETFNNAEEKRNQETEEQHMEQRGNDLLENRAVKVSSGNLITPEHDAESIKSTFNQVSSLIDRVRRVPLEGGESYRRAYQVSYPEGTYTSEGSKYANTDVVTDYVEISKAKVTAYSEETEEVVKLPKANYSRLITEGINKSLRKHITKEILVGDGTTNHFTGIFSSNATAIDPATDKELDAVDENTLDDIVFSYGGDEDVEDDAVLILSKEDLRQFAMLRDNDGNKIYEVTKQGNTGEINGISYLINSACTPLASASAGDYSMAYGNLSNYEMAVFSPVDIQRSNDYKFGEGMIAHRGSVFAGGNVAAQNGFIRVKKATTT